MESDLFKAYAEVDKILSFMGFRYVEKVPKKMRDMFKNEKLQGYEPNIDKNTPLDLFCYKLSFLFQSLFHRVLKQC